MKNTVKTIAKSGENKWKDKTLSKWFVQFEDNTNGTLTTGFQDDDVVPAIGDVLEYETEDKGFGIEIKIPRKTGGFGFGGGAKKWTPEQVAQQDAVKITAAAIESGNLPLVEYKQFFVECKQFMVIQASDTKPATTITEAEQGMPAQVNSALVDPVTGLPF